MLNLTSKIIAYESGELNEEETIDLFQKLVDCGLAWTLQGHYGRTAQALIEAGYVKQVSKSEKSVRKQQKDLTIEREVY